jgi:hypothetical protein
MANTKEILLMLFFPVLTLLMPIGIYRRIEFGDKIGVIRWIYRDKDFRYDDIKDIGSTAILMQNGKIVMHEMENADDLISIFTDIFDSGKIDPNQISGELLEKEKITFEAAAISFPIYLVAHIFLAFTDLTPRINGQLFCGVLFSSIYVITYFVIKMKQSSAGH